MGVSFAFRSKLNNVNGEIIVPVMTFVEIKHEL